MAIKQIPQAIVPASVGGMTLLSTTTLSSTKTVISGISQAYNRLVVYVFGVTGNTNDRLLRCLFNDETSGLHDNVYMIPTATTSGQNGGGAVSVGDAVLLRTSALNAFTITIDNYASSTAYKPYSWYGKYIGSASANSRVSGAGTYSTATAITSLSFDRQGTDTFAGGTVLIYGVK